MKLLCPGDRNPEDGGQAFYTRQTLGSFSLTTPTRSARSAGPLCLLILATCLPTLVLFVAKFYSERPCSLSNLYRYQIQHFYCQQYSQVLRITPQGPFLTAYFERQFISVSSETSAHTERRTGRILTRTKRLHFFAK